MFIKYGKGLRVLSGSPAIDALTAIFNDQSGIAIMGDVVITTTDALIANNKIGAYISENGRFTITNSVIKNNMTNVLNYGSNEVVATRNWWGFLNKQKLLEQ